MNQVKQSAVNSDAAGDAGAFGTPFVLIDSRWLLRAEARRPIRPHHRIVAKAIIEIAQTGEQIGPPSLE
jgi:hypothetical protein